MGLVDDSPAANIDRRHIVGGGNVTAGATTKDIPAFPVGFFGMAALTAFAAGVSWVDQHNTNPGKHGFIGDKLKQLVKTPSIMLRTLRLSNRCLFTDSLKVFKGNAVSKCLSLRNNLFGNSVVLISGEACLFALALFKQALCRFSAFALQFLAQAAMSRTQSVHLVAGVGFTGRIDGNVFDAQVNAKKIFRRCFRWFGKIDHKKQVKRSVFQNQIGLSRDSATGKHSPVVFTDYHRDQNATGKCEQRYPVNAFKRHDALIINHCAGIFESVQGFFGRFVAFANLSDGANRHLGRKAKVFADIVIAKLVDVELGKCFGFKCKLTDVIASLIESCHCFQKRLVLLGINNKFYFRGTKHNSSYHKTLTKTINISTGTFKRKGVAAIPLSLESDSLLAANL